MTNEFKEGDKLCGVRLLDKSMPGKECSFRIEIWTKFSNDSDESGKSMKQYIDETLVSIIKECKDPITSVSPVKFTPHKSVDKAGAKGGY